MRSHLVSQFLLKRFARGGVVGVNSITTHEQRHERVRDIGYVELEEELIGGMERKWQKVESEAANALHKLDAGTLLDSSRNIFAIKRLMAMHFVRSEAFYLLMVSKREEYLDTVVRRLGMQFPAETERLLPVIRSEWMTMIDGSIPGILRDNISKVESFIDSQGIEIGVTPVGVSLILGDNPALTISKDGHLGILAGVPITEATGFSMPLGPKHLVALKTNALSRKYLQLSAEHVRNANEKQLAQAIRVYYSLPSASGSISGRT